MDSGTTDVCEWCNRPMLPAGATVSDKAAKELKKSGTPIAVPHQPQAEEVGLPLSQPEPEEDSAPVEEVATEPAAAPQAKEEVVLQPLGGSSAAAPDRAAKPNVPTHGLGEDATQTSIDISQYVGADQSIFRPIVREDGQSGATSTVDRLGRKLRRSDKHETVSDIPENTRLLRSLVAGLVITLVVSIIQLIITQKAARELQFAGLRIVLSRGDGFMAALMWGIVAGVLLGGMLGAALVRLRKGSFVGAVVGFLVGSGLANPPFAQIAGALTGIVAGRFATIGLRRIVNV